jgi:predicted CoA-substrate-specific enzyme activase
MTPEGAMKSLGICLGASTVSTVQLVQDDTIGIDRPRITSSARHPHDGNPQHTLVSVLNTLDLSAFDRVALTGRKFRRRVNLSSISEPESVELAYQYAKPNGINCPAIVSAGGETFMVYVLDKLGRISNILTGNKCASGTGEFFLQQIRRMNVSLEEAAHWAVEETPHLVSGRCSVFCKSDCTHATNKGIPKSKVTAGLCKMMADKILELLKKVKLEDIMLTGGTVNNHMMITYLRDEIPSLIVPPIGAYFEALGAGLWALANETKPISDTKNLFQSGMTAFKSLPPLSAFEDQVTFKTMTQDNVVNGDTCILGLDVGSTTTKAVLMRTADSAILASVYLRTNGDPVGASRKCYAQLLEQVQTHVDPEAITVTGLGVCGSGRQIAGLHALTDCVINEIIAHATASVYFDAEVDTIFEIGGQDAKYTYITNGVPSDYAMNEACSAGTGSFLEESALESLGLEMEAIADVALQGPKPPNFNDQCAAFISSDIKNAVHEGIPQTDIVAGLVYAICMNYANRVKGNRPIGNKIFLQGGVCYNRAVPMAMASLTGKPIIVPPEPGLMGAFGSALEVRQRIKSGLIQPKHYSLEELSQRQVAYGRAFICKGGKTECDRRCRIEMIKIDGKQYPFGGACNRYDNIRQQKSFPVDMLDLVRGRQQLVFEIHAANGPAAFGLPERGTIGINKSFLVNTYFPLYATFFSQIGYRPLLSPEISTQGLDLRNAPFCFPAELTHGFFHSLITSDPPVDHLFLPHFKSIPSQNGDQSSQVCPFVQGETYYLQTTFREQLQDFQRNGNRILSPLLELKHGLHGAETPLIRTAKQLGIDRKTASKAFEEAQNSQLRCLADMHALGQKALVDLESDPEKIGVVIFSRPYNGFVEEAHMGIPRKLASRGICVIPFDFLPADHEKPKHHMYWGMGQMILKAARLVKNHPQLFGVVITNFSCGPDSFLIGYFRSIMDKKPSLTLELDSHTADAGLDTRIEAFIDIVSAYRKLVQHQQIDSAKKTFIPAIASIRNGSPSITTTSGETVALTDPRTTVLLPSMGKLCSEALAAVLKSMGMHSVAHPPADESILKLGRGYTSCKECLPLILTTGSLLNYILNHQKPGEVLVYFLATGSGPCRFGQYAIFMQDLVKRLALPDVAILTLSSENSYLGMGRQFEQTAWWALVVSDVMEDIRSMLLANAVHRSQAMRVFDDVWQSTLDSIATADFKQLCRSLSNGAKDLAQIALKKPVSSVPLISLTGEIYVRRDALSRQQIPERLADMGIATICSPVAEWVHYTDYLVEERITGADMTLKDRFWFKLRQKFMSHYEHRIRSLLSRSGLVSSHTLSIDEIVHHGVPYIAPALTGEAILTVGSSLAEIATQVCGVIAVGPFGCMPNRLSEAILSKIMHRDDKLKVTRDHRVRQTLANIEELPFLAIETDGSPFPQLIHAKLEAFCLRAERLHREMQQNSRF